MRQKIFKVFYNCCNKLDGAEVVNGEDGFKTVKAVDDIEAKNKLRKYLRKEYRPTKIKINIMAVQIFKPDIE